MRTSAPDRFWSDAAASWICPHCINTTGCLRSTSKTHFQKGSTFDKCRILETCPMSYARRNFEEYPMFIEWRLLETCPMFNDWWNFEGIPHEFIRYWTLGFRVFRVQGFRFRGLGYRSFLKSNTKTVPPPTANPTSRRAEQSVSWSQLMLNTKDRLLIEFLPHTSGTHRALQLGLCSCQQQQADFWILIHIPLKHEQRCELFPAHAFKHLVPVEQVMIFDNISYLNLKLLRAVVTIFVRGFSINKRHPSANLRILVHCPYCLLELLQKRYIFSGDTPSNETFSQAILRRMKHFVRRYFVKWNMFLGDTSSNETCSQAILPQKIHIPRRYSI